MQTLRHMTWLARLVLAGFLLSLGAAMASPAVKPQSLEMVCSGGVFKLVAPQEGGTARMPSALDCPVCAPSGLPPPPPAVAAAPHGHTQVLPAAVPLPHIASPASWPPPARGPPARAVL